MDVVHQAFPASIISARKTMFPLKQLQALLLCCFLALPVFAQSAGTSRTTPATSSSEPPPAELQTLAAPIALYPDPLVAQILAASTYPTQVVEADRWLKQNSNLTGQALFSAVDQQPWDESIKALTQ